MAKNIFYISSTIRQAKEGSITDVSNTLVDLLLVLAKVDKIFLNPVHVREGSPDVPINILELGPENAKEKLARTILETHKADIREYDKEDNPTLFFKRDLGFRYLLQFYSENDFRFSITGNLGTKGQQSISVQYFYSAQVEYSFDWYESVLKCLVNFWNPQYASINISLTSFSELLIDLKIKDPFGWITYFSNEYDLEIPDDLKGIEYEYTNKGKYLILTRGDFTISKEAYEMQRDKLLSIMREVKQRVPEYSRGNI